MIKKNTCWSLGRIICKIEKGIEYNLPI